MNKNELLDLLKEKVGFETKKEVGEFLDKLDVVVEAVAQALEVDQKAKIGSYISVEKRHTEGRTGELNGVKYTSEAKDVTKIKGTGLVKKLV